MKVKVFSKILGFLTVVVVVFVCVCVRVCVCVCVFVCVCLMFSDKTGTRPRTRVGNYFQHFKTGWKS